jgi:hypothetical protein
MSALTCLWVARVAYFGHCLWLSLVLLDSSCWYFSNNTDNVIIRVLVCLWSFFFPFFSPSLSSLYLILSFKFYNLKESQMIHATRKSHVICDFLKCVIYLNILCTVLFYPIFSSMLESKITRCLIIIFSFIKIQYHDHGVNSVLCFFFIGIIQHI